MLRFLLCGIVLLVGSRSLLADDPKSELDSTQQKKILERLNEQTNRLDDLTRQMSILTSRLPNKKKGAMTLLPSRRGEQRFRRLWIAQRDGSEVKPFFDAPGMITTGTPQWSHDGKMIVVDSTPETDAVVKSRIWVYGVAGAFQGMTRYLCAGNTPSWSPDDTKIAFMVNPGNPDNRKPGAWIMQADGTNPQFLGDGWYTRWSPDGKEICVHDTTKSPARLRIYHLENQTQRFVLGEDPGEDIEVIFGGANWTPDGKSLVTLVRRENEQQLITVDANGDRDSIRVIYHEPREDRILVGPPAMSPDGKEIVFAIQDSARPDHTWMNTYVYLIAADGKSAPRLLEGAKLGKINRSMEWSRDGKRILFSSER